MAGGKPVKTVELIGPAGRIAVNPKEVPQYLTQGYKKLVDAEEVEEEVEGEEVEEEVEGEGEGEEDTE